MDTSQLVMQSTHSLQIAFTGDKGSILGPLLFIIFINDLVDICTDNIKMFLFADDATMYYVMLEILWIKTNSNQELINS